MLRRPKTITRSERSPKSLKPQKARQLIRRFHSLQKWKASILKSLQRQDASLQEENYKVRLGADYSAAYSAFKLGTSTVIMSDVAKADANIPHSQLSKILATIDAEIDQRGGLHVYQMASTVGQAHERGGDSSRWLVKWFEERDRRAERTLEIGSLSVHNRISTCGRFGAVTRIDLNSQSPQILQQDFMERPLPQSDAERFDVISCSLVLNFVPTAEQRGQMLRRITSFLRTSHAGPTSPINPSLFLVLPLPCIVNSRYFNHDLLQEIMQELGFQEIERHEAKKVIYLLYDWKGVSNMREPKHRKKRELVSGSRRNNFYIDLS